jgi:hypothetical protein
MGIEEMEFMNEGRGKKEKRVVTNRLSHLHVIDGCLSYLQRFGV